ncbi:MAG TPA: MFS transporter [Pyrinomonadaceae bacterium]|nr:MFS transporter [Pyrinomonadaceae bacterium]
MPASPLSKPVSKATQRKSAFSSLRHRDFRLLWLGQIISVTGSQMQLVAINWHLYLLTNSALALGLVGACRAVPIIACSLMGGLVADVADRRRVMIVTQFVMLASSAVLALLTFNGLKRAWPIFLLTSIASAAWAFDTPARQSLMPALVPAEDFPNAVSLSMLMFQIGMILGPTLAGFLLASRGPGLVYALNAASFVAVIVGLLLMRATARTISDDEKRTTISVDALREGLRFVWRTPIIVQTMTLDFVATFFASANQLLPIFAKDILVVGARGLGFLAAAPASGAIIAGIVMARMGTLKRQGAIVIASVAVFGVATVVFGFSRFFWLSLLMLAITGAADTVSTILRQTIRQLSTPNKLRGRMTSINMIFFMGGPQLGEVEAGGLAALIGAPLSVVTGGIGCVVAAAIAFVKAKSLRSYDIAQTQKAMDQEVKTEGDP